MTAWNRNDPDSGLVAWVKHDDTEVLAVWTGKAWWTMDTHEVLRGVTHWRVQ